MSLLILAIENGTETGRNNALNNLRELARTVDLTRKLRLRMRAALPTSCGHVPRNTRSSFCQGECRTRRSLDVAGDHQIIRRSGTPKTGPDRNAVEDSGMRVGTPCIQRALLTYSRSFASKMSPRKYGFGDRTGDYGSLIE